jgi:hypothetical protein
MEILYIPKLRLLQPLFQRIKKVSHLPMQT